MAELYDHAVKSSREVLRDRMKGVIIFIQSLNLRYRCSSAQFQSSLDHADANIVLIALWQYSKFLKSPPNSSLLCIERSLGYGIIKIDANFSASYGNGDL